MSIPEERPEITNGRTSRRVPKPRGGEHVAGSAAARPFSPNSEVVAALLGGPKILRAASLEMLDVHNAIVQGLPAATLVYLKKSLVCLSTVDLSRALGVSERTIHRHVEQNTKQLGVALGSKAWRFAELLARATQVFGGQEEAERWLSSNVMGLDCWRPIDLLQTSVGAQLLDDFLGRLEYGVYT